MMNNSEILFLYDAAMCNPNGDPDEENRPRMDGAREINLSSDLRLKRYIRDYAFSKGHDLYVQQIVKDGEQIEGPVTAETRVKDYTYDEMLENFYDMRIFGATVTKKGDNRSFTGPVQFNWGYSLNKVELMESSITSTFASSDTNNQGAIGKDYRVKYSFLAYQGVVSGRRTEYTKMTYGDLKFLDKAMIESIPQHVTRSKIGQYPRLYMRVEFIDQETMLKDFRSYIHLTKEKEVYNIKDFELNINDLVHYLDNNADKIQAIHYFIDDELRFEEISSFEEAFSKHQLIKL